jgi:hypothetical protein
MEYLLTFHTQLDAVIARKKLSAKNISAKLSPVPRALSSSCGTCAKVYNANIDDLVSLDVEGIYKIDGDKYIKEVENE